MTALLLSSVTMASVSLTGVVSAAESGDFTYRLINDDAEAEITKYNGPGGEVEIPEEIEGKKVTSVGSNAFYGGNSPTSVTIPSSVTTIGSNAFYGCAALASLAIPSSVTTIGNGAFTNCHVLTSITIPSSVTTIGSGAFNGCAAMNSIDVDENNENYASINGLLCSKDGKTLIQCPAGKSGELTIPSSVTIIGDSALTGCLALTSVIIGDGVTTIGRSAFAGCPALTSVTIGDGVITISDGAFNNCPLTSVTIPDSVTTIGRRAFYYCPALTSVIIGDGVTTIGDSAFASCPALTSITIPSSVTTIGSGAFADCSSMIMINTDENNENYASINGLLCSKDGKTLIQCPAGKSGELTIPSSVTTIGSGSFTSCRVLASVIIPSSVTTIGDNAFAVCPALTSVIMGDCITTIGSGAFAGCPALTSITIPSSVTTIDAWAFFNCVNLTTMVFHGDAPSVGYEWTASSDKLTIYYHKDATGFTTPIWSETYCYPLCVISGTVKDTDGKAVDGATVTLSDGVSVSTDPSGDFILDGILPGTYALTIEKDGYVTLEQEVSASTGEDEELGVLNMSLVPAGHTTPPSANEELDNTDILLIVGVVVAIAMIIAAAVLWMRRRSPP